MNLERRDGYTHAVVTLIPSEILFESVSTLRLAERGLWLAPSTLSNSMSNKILIKCYKLSECYSIDATHI